MTPRTLVLCLDTNASIDFGVVVNLRDRPDSLSDQFDSIRAYWESLHYDEHVKRDVSSMLDARHRQLSAAERFLRIADGHAHIRLPVFAKLEHVRIRSGAQALPPYPASVDPKDALDVALEVFGKTELGLQDAMILASAIEMRADALVSNDEDFGRAFNAGAEALVWKLAGKPLALLDHRSSLQSDATLHAAVAKSLRQRYQRHPSFGRPLYVDQRQDGGGWYLLYRHPLLLDAVDPALVPGQHLLSVMDAHSSIVCEVREMYFFRDSLPDGVTSELIVRMSSDYADEVRRTRHLRPPTDDRPGHVDVAIPLPSLPDQWKNWTATSGGRTHKKLAPDIAVAFVERPR